MSRSLYLDFEFSRVTEEKVNLVCCATLDPKSGERRKFWLHHDRESQKSLCNHLNNYTTLVAYSAIAECRSLLSLGLNPLKFQWVDLFLEYRCLTNHNDELQWGDQLVDGKVKKVFKPKPKWERDEDEPVGTGFRATHSLAEACFKLLGKIVDTEHKNKMRDLIISDPPLFTDLEKESILEYCASDVENLPAMWAKMSEIYLKKDKDLTKKQLVLEAKTRGRYAAHTSIMESKGYPIDLEKTKNFSSSVANILYDCQREINQFFPTILPFKWNKKDGRFRWDQNTTREWILKETDYHHRWDKTDTGQLSLALEAWEKFFPFKHEYPSDNFGAQMVRFLKLKQQMYGFVPSPDKERKSFWNYVGSDGRVRPYMNIYGAQSSRSQPAATGFIYLKPAWVRALVQPAPGMAMAGIDYGSQEFFISALLSRDENMIKSYLSGDVYLAFAKLAGMVPENGTREQYKKERDLCKSTVLGLSYQMSKYGLAIKLTQDTGRMWDEDEAQDMIDTFYSAYPGLSDFQEEIVENYQDRGFLKLPCGWYMWGDNPNFRSVGNVPIQGFGASVMRKAVDLASARGLYVCKTLHDALYIEYKVGNEHEIAILRDCMREAFVHYFPADQKEIAKNIKLDPFAWSPDYQEDGELDIGGWKVPCGKIYIDERAIKEYENFSKYFERPIESDL